MGSIRDLTFIPASTGSETDNMASMYIRVPMLAASGIAALFFMTRLLSAAPSVRPACSMITSADVSAIMAFTVLPGQANPAGPFANHVQLPNEIAASACFFEPSQAATKRFNSGVRITVRYAGLADPEATFNELLAKIDEAGNLLRYPQARGFEYPLMYWNVEHGQTLTSLKAIPDGMLVLQVTVLGPSKESPGGEGTIWEQIFSDELKHGIALSAKIMRTSGPEELSAKSPIRRSEAPTQENVPESELESGSLRGVRRIYFTIQADSSRAREFTAMVEKKLEDHGIEVEYHPQAPWSYPALYLSIDTTSSRCGTMPREVWFVQGSLAVLLPSSQKGKYHAVKVWESARFGESGNIWGSDLNKSQQFGTLTDEFLKEWDKANRER